MSLTDQVQELGTKVLDLIFPPKCVHCKKVGDSQLCQTCRADFTILDQTQACPHCGRPDQHASPCSDCRRELPSASPVYSGYLHIGPVQSAIWALKYENRHALAAVLADAVIAVIPAENLEPFDALCPVPLHAERETERGFNQAHILSLHLSQAWSWLPLLDKHALRRVRQTDSQVGLNRSQRQENVSDAFVAEPSRVTGKSLVLVDDVCTTGSTLNACATALLQAGAARVAAVTVSRAQSTVV